MNAGGRGRKRGHQDHDRVSLTIKVLGSNNDGSGQSGGQCPNPLFYSWIEQLSAEAIAAGDQDRAWTLLQALSSVEKYPLLLETGRDCAPLRGFGKTLCSYLDAKLEKRKCPNRIHSSENKSSKVSVEMSENLSEGNDVEIASSPAVTSSPEARLECSIPETEDIAFQEKRAEYRHFFPEDRKIVLLVDNKETESGPREDDEMKRELRARGVGDCEFRHLSVGDFLWVARCVRTGRELVLPHVVERKRMDDLSKSIVDGRFREQKYRLKKTGVPNVIYMIEKGGSERSRLPEATLMRAAVNTGTRDGFQLRFTASKAASAEFLATMTRLITKDYQNRTLAECRTDDKFAIEDDVVNLPEFNDFNTTFVKYKATDVKNMLVKHLLQIKGMTAEKALAVSRAYSSPQQLIEAYDSAVAPRSGPSLLSNIPYGKENRNLGLKLSKIVYDYFTNSILN